MFDIRKLAVGFKQPRLGNIDDGINKIARFILSTGSIGKWLCG
jgi:hypothetical protein